MVCVLIRCSHLKQKQLIASVYLGFFQRILVLLVCENCSYFIYTELSGTLDLLFDIFRVIEF